MAIVDVLAPVFGDAADEAALAATQTLDVFENAHVAVALTAPLPIPVVTDGLSATFVMSEIADSIRAETRKLRAQLAARRWDRNVEVRTVEGPALLAVQALTMAARHADLAVMSIGADRPEIVGDVFEALLMDSARPILVVPRAWRAKPALKRVFVAWNASRVAARALADAMPFLKRADLVIVGTVDAQPSLTGVGALPGADIAAHLARHGCTVEVRNIDGLGEDSGEAMLSAALAAGADLVVMGGYGHPRLQEALFGGATKTMLRKAPMPLLVSH